MLIYCNVSNPLELWDQFKVHFIEDYVRTLSILLSESAALIDIEAVLSNSGKTLAEYGLPVPAPNNNNQQLNGIDVIVEAQQADLLEQTLTAEQQLLTMSINQAIQDVETNGPINPHIFFLDGPAGTGKTYTYNYLIHRLQGQGKRVKSSAWTGIAATLLKNGTTIHSCFKLPIPVLDNITCRITPNSQKAKELREITLFILDEASMISLPAFNAIDRLMRDITASDVPFGGRIFLLGGDFRQTLPIVKRGSETQIIENCITRSCLWHIVSKFTLTVNQRTRENEQLFSGWLLELGNGQLPRKMQQPFQEAVEIPQQCVVNNITQSIMS